jgi:hypothetical protein
MDWDQTSLASNLERFLKKFSPLSFYNSKMAISNLGMVTNFYQIGHVGSQLESLYKHLLIDGLVCIFSTSTNGVLL